jgi:hypothetical protein
MGSMLSCPTCPTPNCAKTFETYFASSQGISYITTPDKQEVFLAVHKRVGCSGNVYVVDPRKVGASDLILNALLTKSQLFLPLADDVVQELETRKGLLTNLSTPQRQCWGKNGFTQDDEGTYANDTACCESTFNYMKEHLQKRNGGEKIEKDKKAWIQMNLLYHPDKNGTSDDRVSKKLNALKETCRV